MSYRRTVGKVIGKFGEVVTTTELYFPEAGDLIYHNGTHVTASSGSYLVSNGSSMQWVSGDYWDASIQNGQRREDELRLTEELMQKYNKEFTCEFCNRANPIENCECARCGAPRKAV